MLSHENEPNLADTRQRMEGSDESDHPAKRQKVDTGSVIDQPPSCQKAISDTECSASSNDATAEHEQLGTNNDIANTSAGGEVKGDETATEEGNVDVEGTLFGPLEGLRIEVNWVIVDEDTAKESPTWFPGTLVRRLGQSDEDGRDLWELLYDAHGEFPQTTATVGFEQSGEMWDPEQQQHLDWRREGEMDEMTMDDVLKAQEALDRECGSVHDAAMSSFATLPFEQQRVFALKFRNFADQIKEQISRVAQQKGEGGVITEDDIRGIMEKMQS